ncbi:hypothetical protein [Thermicanus aegyptius]|uniref:hypothetical protein n=1 Tax=Thermicanus aegyptius TaxID=94009 RepID=UPI0003FC5DCA|nr:hypothetical protein [Thermicanus aegyptius]
MGNDILFALVLVAIMGGIYFWIKKKNRNQVKKVEKKKATNFVQDLFTGAEVSDDGIIRAGDEWRAAWRIVTPVNLTTMSDAELDIIWKAWRSYTASMVIPHTFLVTSQYLRMGDYIERFKKEMDNAVLTPEMREAGKHVLQHYESLDRDGGIRDKEMYIIVRINPTMQFEGGSVKTGFGLFDTTVNAVSRSYTEEEKEAIAKQMILEVETMLSAAASNMRMRVERLDRKGIYGLAQQVLIREARHTFPVEKIPETAYRTVLKSERGMKYALQKEKETRTRFRTKTR